MKIASIAKGTGVGIAALAGGLVAWGAYAARAAERKVPAGGRFVDVDGARLHYVDMGSGPTIVMIHGLSGQLRNFTYALAERLVRDYRVVVVDRPGSGYSRYVGAGGRGLFAQAAILGRFIAALGLERPLLVGHSLGGAVSLTIAVQRPDAVRGLALIAPLAHPLDLEQAPGLFAPMVIPSRLRRAIVAHTLAVPLGALKRREMVETIFAPEAVPDDFAIAGGAALSGRPGNFDAASTDVTEGVAELADVARRYDTIRVPVGILYGRGDRILDPVLHGTVAAGLIPGAELTMIDGGHMIPVTVPDVVAEWIRGQDARTS